MTRISDEHRQRNVDSRSAWDLFSDHRRRVTEILLATGGGRLSVWGAGNCNDLDLPRLLTKFEAIQLVDIDETAIRTGVARQELTDCDRLTTSNVDVTGVLELLQSPAGSMPSADELDSWQAAIEVASLPDGLAESDATVSLCLLTQLIDSVNLAIGDQHPRFANLALALRKRHLELLLSSVRAGGDAILITDVVSSATFPALVELPADQLNYAIAEQVHRRNFFTGTNPGRLMQLFATDPTLARLSGSVRGLLPWRWDLGPRMYAVYGIHVVRRV